jgi:hypothetical protein
MKLIENDCEGSTHCLIKVFSWHLPGGTKDTQENLKR